MTRSNRGLGRAEIAKDTIQVVAEATATHVGRIASIVTSAVREVAHELGDLASDVFEMRDAAGKAAQAAARDQEVSAP